MGHRSFRNKTNKNNTTKNKKNYLGKTKKNMKRIGGGYCNCSQCQTRSNRPPSRSDQKYLPTQNQSNQSFINKSLQNVNANLTKAIKNPNDINSLNNARSHAQVLNGATQFVARHPSAQQNMGQPKVDKLQNVGNTLLNHVNEFHQSVQRGDHDDTINALGDAAKRSADAATNIVKDKDVQKHLANTGSTLFSMGSNLFDMGHKMSQGKLTYTDAIKGSVKHVALGTQAAIHTSKAGLSAYSAAKKPSPVQQSPSYHY